MTAELVHVGFGNFLAANRVAGIVAPISAHIKRLIQEARNDGQLLDMTNGRRANAVVVLDTGHLALVAIAPEVVAARAAAARFPRSASRSATEAKLSEGP